MLSIRLLGPPQISLLSIHHKVADYGNWRRVYDSMDGMRRQFGMTGDRVFRSAADPNEITSARLLAAGRAGID